MKVVLCDCNELGLNEGGGEGVGEETGVLLCVFSYGDGGRKNAGSVRQGFVCRCSRCSSYGASHGLRSLLLFAPFPIQFEQLSLPSSFAMPLFCVSEVVWGAGLLLVLMSIPIVAAAAAASDTPPIHMCSSSETFLLSPEIRAPVSSGSNKRRRCEKNTGPALQECVFFIRDETCGSKGSPLRLRGGDGFGRGRRRRRRRRWPRGWSRADITT